MQKFFVEDEQIKNNLIEIVGADVNHIINVLRLKQDDEIQICNKESSDNFIAKISEYNKEKVICSIVNKMDYTTETNFNIDLYQGLPKADKMELIIQKTTEIGVKKIIPVSMERCVVKLNEKDSVKKIQRWQMIAEVAAKQSKRDIIPKIDNMININQLCDKIKDYDIFIIAYEEEKKISLKSVLKENKDIKNIGVLVGPEGGIDLKEIEKLKQAGAICVTLGSRILRTETAPIVVASNIVYELEN